MTQQPEALHMADLLERMPEIFKNPIDRKAAAELRRLYAENEALRAKEAIPQQAAPAVGASGFDHKTAADFLSGKTVSDEEMRKFVQASRAAHDDRAGLQATLLSVRGELASREAEIALLKKALIAAETEPKQAAPAAAGSIYRNSVTGAFELIDYAGEGHPPGTHVDIYTAPQQAAPAERKPLTAEQVRQILVEANYYSDDTHDPERAAFINGLRYGEFAHGIKGGQP